MENATIQVAMLSLILLRGMDPWQSSRGIPTYPKKETDAHASGSLAIPGGHGYSLYDRSNSTTTASPDHERLQRNSANSGTAYRQ